MNISSIIYYSIFSLTDRCIYDNRNFSTTVCIISNLALCSWRGDDQTPPFIGLRHRGECFFFFKLFFIINEGIQGPTNQRLIHQTNQPTNQPIIHLPTKYSIIWPGDDSSADYSGLVLHSVCVFCLLPSHGIPANADTARRVLGNQSHCKLVMS